MSTYLMNLFNSLQETFSLSPLYYVLPLKILAFTSTIFFIKSSWNWYCNILAQNDKLIREINDLDKLFLEEVINKLRGNHHQHVEEYIKIHIKSYADFILKQNNLLLENFKESARAGARIDVAEITKIALEVVSPSMNYYTGLVENSLDEIKATKNAELMFELAKSDRTLINTVNSFNSLILGRKSELYSQTYTNCINTYHAVRHELDSPFYINPNQLTGLTGDPISLSIKNIEWYNNANLPRQQ